MQSIDSIKTYAHGMSKDLKRMKEKIKRISIIKQYKMFNFDYIRKEYIRVHNPKWPEVPDHPYGILIIGGSGHGKTNALFNLINHEPDVDKIYLYAEDPYEGKY